MEISSPAAVPEGTSTAEQITTGQIRGSTLLLTGRVITMVINFVTQVLIARHLSKTDYGAFAYGIAFVQLGETIVGFGLSSAITRFVPIFHERREYNKLFGTLLMVVGTILSLGLCLIVVTHGLRGLVTRGAPSHDAASLLLILIALAPLSAIDSFLMNMFAVFTKPRQIFFRRYVLEPGLKLAVVLVLVLQGSGVFFLAGGYVTISAVGVVIYAALFVRLLRQVGVLKHFNRQNITMPVREIFAFTIPMLATSVAGPIMAATDAMIVGHYRGTVALASLRVVIPVAMLIQLIMSSFVVLFTPTAARLFARNDREGIEHLYWQTAIVCAVISFPIFATMFLLARPLTTLAYGARYESSALLLSVLALGQYAQVVTGLNGTVLMVFGKLRYIVLTSLAAVLTNLIVDLALVPHYGALGAAISTTSTLVVFNIFKQTGLRLAGISVLPRRHFKLYASVVFATLVLVTVRVVAPTNTLLGLTVVGTVSLALVALNRESLRIGSTFPELRRFRLTRLLVG